MKRNESRLTILARFTLMCALTIAPIVRAQSPTQQTPAQPDVTIVIQQQQVRFSAPPATEQMHLEVRDQAGEVVFDSGASGVRDIFWLLQNTDGTALRSGLYGYTLTLKAAGDKEARVRRGHFIVDRAQDRDGSDKLWVTSANSSGVGTDLTVARDETAVVAGATTTSPERTLGAQRESSARTGERGLDPSKQLQTAAKTAAVAAANGTPGQIAKFTSSTDLGNSVMTEVNGGVGIGASPRAGYRFHVEGSTLLNIGNGGEIAFGTPNSETGMTISRGTGRADLRFDGSTFKFVAGAAGGPPSNANGLAVNLAGKAAFGTTSFSASRVTIEGQDALTVRGYEPFVNLQDSNDFFYQNGHRIQSAHGDLNFFHGYYEFSGGALGTRKYVYVPRLVIKDDGNVGIGTSTPNHQLSLGHGPLWTRNGWGGAVELDNASAIGWRANSAGNRFGIGATNSGLYFFRTASDPGTTGSPANYDMWINDLGVVNLRTLSIVGGADFAENFDISATSAESDATPQLTAGMVVSIDPLNPGKLALSTQAYDRRVAGIISGAGGVKPGMTMGQEGTLANGQHPVALSGRVYVWVDATQGAIEPGDLLTTAATPGHAMKAADPAKAQGAILGKAMTGLKQGKGLVLVLVTLQ